MSPKRTVMHTFGKKRKRNYVRVVREHGLIRVLWREPHRRTESFSDTRNGLREATAYAEGLHERLSGPIVSQYDPLTVRDLFDRYVTAKIDAWRPRTLVLERARWRKFELFVNRDTVASLVRPELIDHFKRELIAKGHAVNQVARHIECVRRVFAFAVQRDLIPPTKVTTYETEFSKDALAAAPKMAEYGADERGKLLAAIDPRSARQWRAWALTTLIGFCGPRQTAARHLRWSDIDLEAGLLTWRAAYDKRGNERQQPIPAPVLEALWVAYGWRLADRYQGGWVFYAAQDRTRKKDKPWTYQAYNQALREAETRAGVAHVKWRAAHGFRRGIAGDVLSKTGSEKRAAEWIGDRDIRVVKKSYLLEREEELRKTAELLGGDSGR